MSFGVPQTILISAYLFAVGFSTAKHGQSRPDVNFYVVGLTFLAEFFLLRWGGFFTEMAAPQIAFAGISCIGLIMNALAHGRSPGTQYHGLAALAAAGVVLFIYCAGGFFG